MIRIQLATLLFLIASICVPGMAQQATSTPQADEAKEKAKNSWLQFRGNNANSVATTRSSPVAWSDGAKNIAWTSPIKGLGWSSPVVKDGLAWLTTAVDNKSLRLVAINVENGKQVHDFEIFNQSLGRIHQKNSHASPTPILDEKLIFVHFGDYGTAAVDYAGKIVWKEQFKYGHFHGPGGSPALIKDRLIIACDGDKEQFVVALNKNTGKQIWKTKRKHINPDRLSGAEMVPIAFSTPCIHKTKSGYQAIVPGADHTAAYDVETGKEIWWAPYDGFSVVPMAVTSGNLAFYSSGYMRPIIYAAKILEDGTDTKTEIVWQENKGGPANPSPLVVGQNLFVISDNGVASCLDAKTGKVHWQERMKGNYSASPLFAGGKIYFQSEKGLTTIVNAASEYKVLAQNQLSARTLASPVPINGALLLRTSKGLVRINHATGPTKQK